ncbi:MAG: membrane protein insertion efficiency factor YidD [Bdellovibrionota bacterium]
MLKFYRWISPVWQWLLRSHGAACQCKFPISCSEFALMELQNNPKLHHACGKIFLRLWNCSPWGKSFY